MRIGLLEVGSPPREMANVPSYLQMIRTALGITFDYRQYAVRDGELPDTHTAADAYVITGSSSGVHDSDLWIQRLRTWLTVLEPTTPLVGICFGHQMMAQTYGGVVETSENGWGVGLHEYTVLTRESWMNSESRITLPVVHRDQVVRIPSAANVIAGSDFCPYAVLTYKDRRALSFQAHPEFSREFARRVVDRCREKNVISGAQADHAQASLHRADDCARVMGWIRRFLAGTH